MLNAEDELRDQAALAESDPEEQKPLRRVSDQTPLGRKIGPIERAFGTGDYALANELLEQHTLAAWYGFSPHRFAEILATLTRDGGSPGGFVTSMSAILSPTSAIEVEAGGREEITPAEGSFEHFAALAGQMFSLRLEGRSVEALRIADGLNNGAAGLILQPVFDSQKGWGLFSAVQHGITAMLAGEFGRALASFAQARMHVRVPELAFLARDACIKAGIVEVLYGDPERARALLEESDLIPRTESWAEAGIDVCGTIATASLLADEPSEAVRLLTALPLHDIGEMWPFYAEAIHRSLLLADRVADAQTQHKFFEQLPIPRVEGQGYSGSVLLLHAAQRSMMSGDFIATRDGIERADGSIAVTGLLSATFELVAGRPRESLNLTAGLRESTEGLRLLDLQRLSIIAGSLFAQGLRDQCRDVIHLVLKTVPDLTSWEAKNFPRVVRELAEAEFNDWPRVDAGTLLGLDAIPDQRDVLTIREQELLHELADGRTRERIAKSQFISMNTLKTHLRSIYRKLGVNSRAAAVIEAERRGLL